MGNLNRQRAMYFIWHPGVDQLFFTADDTCFLPNHESHAQAHANALADKTIDTVTREEFGAWWAEEVPKLKAEAQDAVDKSRARVAEAQEALNKLGAKAKPADVGKANLALANAERAAKAAEHELEVANKFEAALKPVKTIDVVVTQQMLDENPELAAQDVKVGDTISVPDTAGDDAADVKEAAKKKTAKKKK
jgi:hypothetical protein